MIHFSGSDDTGLAVAVDDLSECAEEIGGEAGKKIGKLSAKIARGRRVGFGPLLILGIISLVVQIVRLWLEWKRKQESK